MASTASNAPELAQLRDIHIPEAVGWWPPAWGWSVLAFLVMMALLSAGFLLWRWHAYGRAKRQALRLLASYQHQFQRDKNSQLSSAQVSELLKRVALVYYPRALVASLQGDPWVTFLNHTAKNLDFRCVRRELLELPYQPKQDQDLQSLFSMTRAWIKQRGKPCLN